MAAPFGNKNATKSQPWSDALRRSLLAKNGKRLRSLADRLLDEALNGNVAAFKEIGDRVEGRPKQQVEITGAGGSDLIPTIDVTEVARSIGYLLTATTQTPEIKTINELADVT